MCFSIIVDISNMINLQQVVFNLVDVHTCIVICMMSEGENGCV